MNDNSIDWSIVNYTNKIVFNNRKLAFKNKILFDITALPKRLELVNNNGVLGWYVNGKFLSKNYAKGLVELENTVININSLQWFEQINVNKPI